MNNVINLPTSTKPTPVPLSWVESLFTRLQGMYGSKFIDMWRDADIEIVKALWADEMGKLSADELRYGFQQLMTKTWPPTLPEYIQLCKSAEKKNPAHAFGLPAPKSDLSREKAGEMLVTLGAAGIMSTKTDHLRWAKNIMERSKKTNHGMSALQIRFAKEALAS